MASLDTSTNGASINKSYQAVVDAPLPASASVSPTYGQWAVFSVQAPLANAFQPDAGKESTLKVQTSGDGELADLVEEFSDGRIQFAFVKVKDPNTGLPKNVMIGWCGEGVPERTKGYFTSHMNTVSRILQGYHVQITARNDSMLVPESIVQKVADASGSKYSAITGASKPMAGPPPPVASKPVFTPSRVAGASSAFQPLASRGKPRGPQNDTNDGWGDADDVSRSTLQPVQSAYKPTKVDMASLTSQRQQFNYQAPIRESNPDVVKGAYQPIGKVDIAAIRRQAAEQGKAADDRPTVVKGAYEPIGKVDIAAIRAKAAAAPPGPSSVIRAANESQPAQAEEAPKSLAERSAAFYSSDRLSEMPKPKVANKFGSSANTFTGTKAPTPGGFGAQPTNPTAAPVGTASRTFADQGGKTPAQIWAEKKARQGGTIPAPVSRPAEPISSQASGGWQSGYSGKKWDAVQTTKTGGSGPAVSAHATGNDPSQDEAEVPSGGVGSIRDRFKDTVPIGGAPPQKDFSAPAPPALDTSSKPNAGATRGVPVPGLSQPAESGHGNLPPPPPQPRSPDPPTPEYEPSSPIRIAQPIAHTREKPIEPPQEEFDVPPVPAESIARAAPAEQDLEPEPQVESHDPARAAGAAAAATTFGAGAVAAANPGASIGGKRARAEYDYEKAEDNELELREGDIVSNIDMVDEDWWMGQNERGESGLFPSNYVTLLEEEPEQPSGSHETASAPLSGSALAQEEGQASGATATAEYDYDAAEDNELSFPEGALITDIEFPDEDWWFGHYNGKSGLFPANFVTRH